MSAESRVLSLVDYVRQGYLDSSPCFARGRCPLGMTRTVNTAWWKADSVYELPNLYSSRLRGRCSEFQ